MHKETNYGSQIVINFKWHIITSQKLDKHSNENKVIQHKYYKDR